MKKQTDEYWNNWKEATKEQRQLEGFLALKRDTDSECLTTVTKLSGFWSSLTKARLSEHSLDRPTQTEVAPKEERLCIHYNQNQVETQLLHSKRPVNYVRTSEKIPKK